ncbi:DUF5047 domain-containing protein [Amycolatopsis sp. SID8362]|uniref:DUF5047 domain-containing protein n=1 Tax=Amycolatopsis sp. SID8362 TaxID=2690346 RepID=UPI00136DBFDD|nr:DUF5047 domain-containing protein [Amycolatopsis sp. SID8362]NBH01932.1 DUF5047 domain-containing protein [Amycolatopsis sp. SID8362]NED38635.1 DUF5047 domain-containing protein [Amycolatopsis sp. SID8362]
MRPTTDSFLTGLRGSHTLASRCTLVAPGQTGTSPNGITIPGVSDLGRLPILTGDVTTDMTADVQSTLDLTTRYPWPSKPSDPGTPYGQEIYVERGIEYGTGTQELVGLGYYRIDKVEQQSVPDGAIRITASDRMAMVRDARNTAPVQFGSGASVGSVIDYVVGQAVPGLVTVYDFDAYSTLLGADHVLDEDRLGFVQDLLAAYGKYGYFDYAGRFQVKSIPDLTKASPVWEINSGTRGVLVSMQRTISRDAVYNIVVARGEPVGELPPVQAVVSDDDPNSPTWVGGPFGLVPTVYSSAFMTTAGQCQQAAAAKLAKVIGLPYAVSLGSVPNPALEGWDVVTVSYPGNSEVHVIDRITYGLAPGDSMGIDTRKQYLTRRAG